MRRCWNGTPLTSYKRRLARFVGDEAAQALSSEKDAALSYSEGDPVSLHGKFMVAHQKVRALMDCVRAKCDAKANEQALQTAQQQVNDLGLAVDGFLERCTDALYSRTGAKEEAKPAEKGNSEPS